MASLVKSFSDKLMLILILTSSANLVSCSSNNSLSDLDLSRSLLGMSGYSKVKYELSLLDDSLNSEIIKHCIGGVDTSDLFKQKIDSLNYRLGELLEGNILNQIGNKIYPTFPILTDQNRTLMQKIACEEATELIPDLKYIISSLTSDFGIESNDLFHLLWSRIMDDPSVWDIIWKKQYPNERFPYLFWIIYPPHPYTCGTNYYTFVDGDIAVSWGPHLKDHLDIIPKIKKELYYLAINMPEYNQSNMEMLAETGIISRSGRPNFKVILKNDLLNNFCIEQSSKYAQLINTKIDFSNPFDTTFISDPQYLIVLLHEIAYFIFEELDKQQLIDFPLDGEDHNDVSNLISIVTDIPKNQIDFVMALYQLNGWKGNLEIVDEFEKILNSSSLEKEQLFYYGLSLFDVGKYKRSVEVFKDLIKALTNKPDNNRLFDWSHIWIGHNYDMLNDRSQAIEYYTKVLSFNHESKMQMLQYNIPMITAKEWALKRLERRFEIKED